VAELYCEVTIGYNPRWACSTTTPSSSHARPSTSRPAPGRLSALSVSPSKSVFVCGFVWACRALNGLKRRSPARADPRGAPGRRAALHLPRLPERARPHAGAVELHRALLSRGRPRPPRRSDAAHSRGILCREIREWTSCDALRGAWTILTSRGQVSYEPWLPAWR
jgi:hypothetical protein